MRKPNSVVLGMIGSLAAGPALAYLAPSWGIDVSERYLTFDDETANGFPSDGVIPGTYTSTILLAGVTPKYRY